MTPLERAMDEAVWRAFVHRDFSAVLRCLDYDMAMTGLDVNYRRLGADFTSALMAAAHHGDGHLVGRLLKKGALVCAKDCHGRSAVHFAREAGHTALATHLTEKLRGELGDAWHAYKGQYLVPGGPLSAAAPCPDDEIVYDLYYLSGGVEGPSAAASESEGLPSVTVAGLDENAEGDDTDAAWDAWGEGASTERCAVELYIPFSPRVVKVI